MDLEKWLHGLQLSYIASLSLSFILTIVIYPLSKRVSDDKDKQIATIQARAAENEARAEEARAAAAQAQLEASQAQLELARFKAPRTITPDQSMAVVQAVRGFEGQHYAFASYGDAEALDYVRQIDRVLKKAGWVRVPSQLGAVKVMVSGMTVGQSAGSRGVFVLIGEDNSESAPALAALAKVLNDVGIVCGKGFAPTLKGKTPKAITIEVGQKRAEP